MLRQVKSLAQDAHVAKAEGCCSRQNDWLPFWELVVVPFLLLDVVDSHWKC